MSILSFLLGHDAAEQREANEKIAKHLATTKLEMAEAKEEIARLMATIRHFEGSMGPLIMDKKALTDELSELRAIVANRDKDGPKADLEKRDNAQAARAMARNTKQAFQAYQSAVKIMLNRLDGLARGNVVTKEDIRKLRELRVDLSNQLGRSL